VCVAYCLNILVFYTLQYNTGLPVCFYIIWVTTSFRDWASINFIGLAEIWLETTNKCNRHVADDIFQFEIGFDCACLFFRSRSNSPVFRSRSRSPREWKRPERRGADRDRGADRQSSRDPHGKVRLYISNLPYDIRWQDLKDLFREKGMISVT